MTNATPKTIAFCFHHAERSGASLWLERFLLARPLDGWRVLAVLPSESPMEESLRAAGCEVHRMNVTQRAFSTARLTEKPALLANRFASLGEYRRLFKAEGVDLVYVNSSLQIAPMVAAKAANCELVVHVHEAWSRGRTFGIKRAAIRRLAHGAIFASQRGISLFGGEPAGKHWLFSPNGVDPKLSGMRESRDSTRSVLGIAPDQKLYLFLGTMQAIKGIHDLLNVWPEFHRQHPNARLVFAGGVAKGDSHPAIDAFLEEGLPGAEYLGFRRDALELIAAADWMVLPSYGEAMPLSVVEAMMIGTPVVARDVGDVAWLLEDERGVVFSGDGPAVLDVAMRKTISSDSGQLADNAQAFAKEHLTNGQQQDQLRDYLEGLLRD